MIDLTPLDVRKKRGDFRKGLRGYDPQEVDTFMDLVAERLEELVKENLTLRERTERLQQQVTSQEGRERAVQDALVTAQQLREEVRDQARREAELMRREAEGDAQRILDEARRLLGERRAALEELERKRLRFLKGFRSLLERELDLVEVEENRTPLEDRPIDLDLGSSRGASARGGGGSGPEGWLGDTGSDPVGGEAEAAAREAAQALDVLAGEEEPSPAASARERETPGAEGPHAEASSPTGATARLPDRPARGTSGGGSVHGGPHGPVAGGVTARGGEGAEGSAGPGRDEEGELWLSSILKEEKDSEPGGGAWG